MPMGQIYQENPWMAECWNIISLPSKEIEEITLHCTYRFKFQSLPAFLFEKDGGQFVEARREGPKMLIAFLQHLSWNQTHEDYQTDRFRMTGKLDSWHLTVQAPSPCGATCYHPIIYGNHLMTWILFASGDLVHKWYGILQINCDKENKKKKGQEGRKELKQRPQAIMTTWSYRLSMAKFF